jgi:hypothetical protein
LDAVVIVKFNIEKAIQSEQRFSTKLPQKNGEKEGWSGDGRKEGMVGG